MSDQLWSWLLGIVGVTGFLLAGKKVWWCWYINVGCQALWFTYSIVTEQWGFLVATIVYTVVFTRNAVVWTREHRREQALARTSKPIGQIESVTEDRRGIYIKGTIDDQDFLDKMRAVQAKNDFFAAHLKAKDDKK